MKANRIVDAVPIKKMEEESCGADIYLSLKPTLNFSRIFAQSSLNIKYRRLWTWKNLFAIYTLIILLGLLFVSAVISAHFFVSIPTNGKITATDLAVRLLGPLFYISSTLSFVLTFKFTAQLGKVFEAWNEAAQRLKKYSQTDNGLSTIRRWVTTSDGCQMSVRCSTLITVIFMTSAIVEHTLHDVNMFLSCNCSARATFGEMLDCHLDETSNFVRHLIGYYRGLLMIVYLINKYANFAWNFHDLLVIQLSIALAINFDVIKRYLNNAKDEGRQVQVDWKRLREDHQMLSQLVHTLDDHLSPVILLSYFVNIYFLANQIYLGVKLQTGSFIEVSYVVTSFNHLIGRLVMVTVSASYLYEQALHPLKELLHWPSSNFDKESQRFLEYLNDCSIGFTGMRMFVINRRLFIAVTSLLFTYELMLNNVKLTKD